MGRVESSTTEFSNLAGQGVGQQSETGSDCTLQPQNHPLIGAETTNSSQEYRVIKKIQSVMDMPLLTIFPGPVLAMSQPSILTLLPLALLYQMIQPENTLIHCI